MQCSTSPLSPFPFPLDLSPISENTGNIDLLFAKWETGELRGFDDRKVLKVLLALAYHASATACNNTSGEIVCKENFQVVFLLQIVLCKQWILAWKTGSQGGFLLWSLINCKEATLKTVRTSKVDSKTSQWYCPGSKVCVSLGTRPAWLPWEQTNYWLPCTLDTGGQSHNRMDAHLIFWHLFKERMHLSSFYFVGSRASYFHEQN